MKEQIVNPEDPEYQRHLAGEVAHYSEIFLAETERARQSQKTLTQSVPASWSEVELRARQLVIDRTGYDALEHVMLRLKESTGARMLSLGSGPGGTEIDLAARLPDARIDCLDCNAALLNLGKARAGEAGLKVTFEQADLNTVDLPSAEYDIVFCHAALHHVIELDRLAGQIRRTVRPGGHLITVDIISRNGYLMWPETSTVVRNIWRTLPEKFRVNHTAYSEPKVDDEIWEADTSISSMECIRSQEILPILSREFKTIHLVPYFSICRRLLDTMYGPNYDLTCSLDMAILDWIWHLDKHHLSTGHLKPETFFGIFAV